MRILFVTWDGPQVNYLEGLFLPIFRGLMTAGHRVDILQFGWADPPQVAAIEEICQANGVGYRFVQVWRQAGGAGALTSAIRGGWSIRRALADFGSDVLMVRSLLPALSAVVARPQPGVLFVFDADGLAADERVDFAGLSPRSPTYRMLRTIEAQAVRTACAVLVRSRAGADILRERAGAGTGADRFFKVVNGRDPTVFQPFDDVTRQAVRREIGVGSGAPLLVYAGSIGAQYRLSDLAALLGSARTLRPDAHLLVLSGSPDEARAALLASNASLSASVTVIRAAPADVPRYLAAADLGTAYRVPSFSMRGVAPIKLSEYLLCGLPIAGTAAVGDTGRIIDAGLFCDDRLGPAATASWLMDDVLPQRASYRTRARELGRSVFSLDQSIASYLAALRHCSAHMSRDQTNMPR